MMRLLYGYGLVWIGLDKNDLAKFRIGKSTSFVCLFFIKGAYATMATITNRYLRLGKIEVML